MSFEIKFFNGPFFDESNEDAFDFNAALYDEIVDPEQEVIGKDTLAEANGVIAQGTANALFWISDVDADTCVEGYVNFLNFLGDDEIHDFPEDFFRVMIIKSLNANVIGKGSGTKLLSYLKHYALTTGLNHIALIADSNSQVDLDKYYEKAGFLKLSFDNWLYVVDAESREYVANSLALYLEQSPS
jgi:hypothetical protein